MREQLEESITCGEAARAISRQLDRSLPRAERGALRAHLRECEECATFARKARAQRGAMKSLGAVPLPASLLSWVSGQGTAGIGAAVGLKLAAGVAAVCAGRGRGGSDHPARRSRSPKRAEAAKRGSRGLVPAPAGRIVTRPRAGVPPARARAARLGLGLESRRRGGVRRSGPMRAASTKPAAGHRGAAVRAHGTPPAQVPGQAVRAHGIPVAGARQCGEGPRNSTPANRASAVRAHGQPPKPHHQPPAPTRELRPRTATAPTSPPPGQAHKPPKP